MRYFFSILLILFFLGGCASKKHKNISYSSHAGINALPKLNLFVPRHSAQEVMPVLIFIHGGNWDSGNKNLYGFFGRNFAKKDIITIIPSYTLSPNADYNLMATEIADVIRWTKANAGKYGGDASKVFITGHSAGGHLAALAVMNPKYGIDPKSISGIILNDAAGLDMNHYLEENPPEGNYLTTWTSDARNWKDASPIYFLNKNTPPIKIYVGKKTYESIRIANSRFLLALKKFQPEAEAIYLNKKHVPMILQYFWPWSARFDEISTFMIAP